MSVIRALSAEFGKLKRERMPLWTALVVIGYTSIGFAMFPLLEDLKASGKVGSASVGEVFAKAGITDINWDSAMRFVPMGVSGAWGVMLFSLIAAYVFGRELREGTDISTATLPIRREYFVASKMIVIAVWIVALALLAVVVDIAVVAVYMGFGTFSWSYVWRAFVETLYASAPIYLTLPLIGWLSLTRKGYLRPMVFSVLAFMVAMSVMGSKAAAYFPWSMPIAAVGVTWMPLKGELTLVSWVIAAAVFVVGLLGALRSMNRAESRA